jgi:hypothetical protein
MSFTVRGLVACDPYNVRVTLDTATDLKHASVMSKNESDFFSHKSRHPASPGIEPATFRCNGQRANRYTIALRILFNFIVFTTRKRHVEPNRSMFFLNIAFRSFRTNSNSLCIMVNRFT